MSRKFGFGKPSPGDDETTDAKGEKNEVSRDADATQAVTPPLPANPLRHASEGAPADPTKGPAATDAADEDASGMLAYQNLERHRKEKRRRRNVKIAVGANNQYRYTKYFQEAYGMTPKEYSQLHAPQQKS